MIVIGHSVSKQATVFRLERRLRSVGQLWEDTVYTISNAEVSHPEPSTLQVAKSRRQAKQVAVIGIVLFAVWCGLFLWFLPAWSASAWAGEDLWDPLTVAWLLGFLVVSVVLLQMTFRHTRIAGEGDAFMFAVEGGTIEHNGTFVARFADLARIEITRSVRDPDAPYTYWLLVVLKSKKVLRICWLVQIPWEWDAVRRQFTELAQELANILGVELRYQTYV